MDNSAGQAADDEAVGHVRLMALRALMDGRGLEALVLRRPGAIARVLPGVTGAALIVRAGAALIVGAEGRVPAGVAAAADLAGALAGAGRIGTDDPASPLAAAIDRMLEAAPAAPAA